MSYHGFDIDRRTSAERILLAVEPVPNAQLVINAAVRLAQRLQAEVIVLSVRERAYARGIAWDVRPAGELAEVVSHGIYELQRLDIKARGVIGKARVGHVADEIVYAALRYRADEIVIGTSGRNLIGSLLASSVAPRVLRLSTLPVITVPTRRGRPPVPARMPSRHVQPAA